MRRTHERRIDSHIAVVDTDALWVDVDVDDLGETRVLWEIRKGTVDDGGA